MAQQTVYELVKKTGAKQRLLCHLSNVARTVVWTWSPNSARTGNGIITKRGQNGKAIRSLGRCRCI